VKNARMINPQELKEAFTGGEDEFKVTLFIAWVSFANLPIPANPPQ
jgi:hypothetical protein